ncbi:MAG: hypothetical protein NTV29_04845 [Planctomycetota bacterium]|nr:hypothetical protein [Planctomycetota bacterium]
MRSFYAPTDPQDAESVKILASEVKRTLMSATSQRPGLKVDQLIVWTKDSLAPFAQALSQATDMPVKMLDPFTMAERADISVAATTQTVGRFAPVLGALQFPNSSDYLIDFANPRKKVERKRPIAKYILAGAAATGLLAASWWWYSSSHAALDQEIALLKTEVASDVPILKTSTKNLADWKKVETFLQGDILWVDELERLSQNAKDSETTYFGGTTFALETRSNNATIATKFFTKEQELVPEIQGAYRDEKHNVRGTGLAQSQDKKYPVAADMLITVATSQVIDPRNVKRKPIEPAATEPAATEPAATEPAATEPAATEPAATEPAKTEPAKTEPAKTEPAKTEPAKTEPAKTEPAKTEPAKTEPAKTEPKPTTEKPESTEPEPASSKPAEPSKNEPILGGAS